MAAPFSNRTDAATRVHSGVRSSLQRESCELAPADALLAGTLSRATPARQRELRSVRRLCVLWPGALILAMLLGGCRERDASAPNLPPNVLALVGDASIPAEALTNALARPNLDELGGDPVESCVQELVRTEVLYQAARAEGFDRSQEVQAALASNALPGAPRADAPAVSDQAREFIAARWLEREVAHRPAAWQVSDAEIQAYYRDHDEEFTTPPVANLALIFLRTATNASPEAREAVRRRAEALHHQARALPDMRDFGALAREHSQDLATRAAGGETGWIRSDATNRWPAEMLQAAFALQNPGDLSPVVATANGYYLLRLIKRRPASVSAWAEAREVIRYRLTMRKVAETEQRILEAARKKLPIQINHSLVQALREHRRTNSPATGPTRF
jgi:parvulin-like peptidyl-prolyl isomerase